MANHDLPIQQFRDKVYAHFTERPDSALDLIDALTQAGHVDSPVALSEEPLFRRHFSSVYDVLAHAQLDQPKLVQTLSELQPLDSQTIAGYAVYAVDCTPNERAQAKTLPDRTQWKRAKNEPTHVGHKYSWLVRLVSERSSWVAPLAVTRVQSETSDSAVAAEQVKALAERSANPTVVVADSLYGNTVFLSIFLLVKTVYTLVRLRHNRSLFEAPTPKPPKSKGAPRKHGGKFKPSNPARAPDRTEQHPWGPLTLRLSAWHGLHFRQLWQLVGLVLCIELLKADGRPLFKRPIWLFWSGPSSVSLVALARMYFWRFGIEHFFRFLKQHLGLNANRSTQLHQAELWMWCCALAYWQLLLMRPLVAAARPAWHPQCVNGGAKPLTPGQVQRAAGRFLLQLGTPACAPKLAKKGRGRLPGYRPAPRERHPVITKSQREVLQP